MVWQAVEPERRASKHTHTLACHHRRWSAAGTTNNTICIVCIISAHKTPAQSRRPGVYGRHRTCVSRCVGKGRGITYAVTLIGERMGELIACWDRPLTAVVSCCRSAYHQRGPADCVWRRRRDTVRYQSVFHLVLKKGNIQFLPPPRAVNGMAKRSCSACSTRPKVASPSTNHGRGGGFFSPLCAFT